MAACHTGIFKRSQTTGWQTSRLSRTDHGDRSAGEMDGATLQDRAQLDDHPRVGGARRSFDARPVGRDTRGDR